MSLGDALGKGRVYLLYTIQECGIESTIWKGNIIVNDIGQEHVQCTQMHQSKLLARPKP